MPPFSLKNAMRTQISIRSSITILLRTSVTPATYRLDAFRRNYMKGGLIGTYVYLAFKSLSGKARHQGLLTHDQEGSFTAEMGKRLPQRSPAPLAMLLASVLVTICLLLWMVQNAITTNKNDSLVGESSKRVTLTPLSSSCVGSDSRRVISPSLTTPNFSVRRRMLPSPPSKAASSLSLPAPLSAPYRDAPRASYAKTRKERQDPRSRKSSPGNAPWPLPCHRHHAL